MRLSWPAPEILQRSSVNLGRQGCLRLGGKLEKALTDYRAHSDPPPFAFTAISDNVFGVPPGVSSAAADGFWIMLMPLSPGSHTIHFTAVVPFKLFKFTFSDDATFTLIVR